jgi:dTDP-4-dehydrorhamnose 3,5-epimerase
VFELTGHDPSRVTGVSTVDYFASASAPVAPRPANSMLDLAKITSAGFEPKDAGEQLLRYLG